MILGCGLFGSTAVAEDSEFRRALLINTSTDKANAAKIERLKRTLESTGFEVTYLPNARKDGYPAYERFVRGLPVRGKSIFYYCGDIDIVKDPLTKRTVYLYPLGKYQFIPPEIYPIGARMSAKDYPRPLPTKRTNRDPDGRSVRAFGQASTQHLMVLDIQGFKNAENPDETFERNLLGVRFLELKGDQAERTFVYVNKKEKNGAQMAESVASALASGRSVRKALAADALMFGAESGDFTLQGEAATVISPPTRLIAGKKAGDQWLDPQGTCFLWVPPGSFTMGCADFVDAEPKSVTISKGFWMGKYEFTRGKFKPVNYLSREQLVNSLQVESRRAEQSGRSFAGWSYDLPTEAEWEYACRAGDAKHAPAPFNKLGEYANFADRLLYGVEGQFGVDTHLYAYQGANDGFGLGAAPVGQYKPNAWGFHDMLGNVAEYCADYYKQELNGGVDPLEQYLESDRKIHQRQGVYRGGAWCTTPNFLNYAYRGFGHPKSDGFVGVRLIIRQGAQRSRTAAENAASASLSK